MHYINPLRGSNKKKREREKPKFQNDQNLLEDDFVFHFLFDFAYEADIRKPCSSHFAFHFIFRFMSTIQIQLGIIRTSAAHFLTVDSENSCERKAHLRTTPLQINKCVICQHIFTTVKHLCFSARHAPISWNSKRRKRQDHISQMEHIPKLMWKTELN